MNTDEETPPIPEENCKIQWMNYSVAVDFHPQIKMPRKSGLEFATTVSECLDPEELQIDNNSWFYTGGAACDGITVRILKDFIRINVKQPSNSLEWYEQKFTTVLESFEEKFEPKVVLSTHVRVSGLVELQNGGDARAFLAGYVMLMHPSRLDPIDRPVNLLGVRLGLPAFEGNEEEGIEGSDWHIDLRVESWHEDHSKLFLDAEADWGMQEVWNENSVSNMVSKLSKVEHFIKDNVIKFLRKPPFPDDDDLEEEEPNNE